MFWELSPAFFPPQLVRSHQSVMYCRRHLVLKQFPPPWLPLFPVYLGTLSTLFDNKWTIHSEITLFLFPTSPPLLAHVQRHTCTTIWNVRFGNFTPLLVNTDKMHWYSFEGKQSQFYEMCFVRRAKHYLPCGHNTLYWLWIVRRW